MVTVPLKAGVMRSVDACLPRAYTIPGSSLTYSRTTVVTFSSWMMPCVLTPRHKSKLRMAFIHRILIATSLFRTRVGGELLEL